MRHFIQPEQYIRQSTQNRLSVDPGNLCTWGIDYLDYHFGGGIAPRSFNLLACESGRGKTTAVSNMAMENSIRGKKVAFVRLEGDMYDFADTEKWKLIYAPIVQKFRNGEFSELPDYQAYRLNNIPGIEPFEKQAEEMLLERLKNVYLYDKLTYPTVNKDTIHTILQDIHGHVDLIIIDHLHYFDLVDERRQWREQMETVKLLNDFVDKVGTPVVLVSHIKKRENKEKKQLLSLDDIQGSSDIFKISHTTLFMSPYYEEYDMENKIYPTLFYSPKARYGAPPTRIGIKQFDGKSKSYIDGYEIAEQKIIKGQWKLVRSTDREKYGANNF